MNKYYLPHSSGASVVYKNKQEVFVVITMNCDMYANTYSEWLPLIEVEQNTIFKKLYEDKSEAKIPKKIKSSDRILENIQID